MSTGGLLVGGVILLVTLWWIASPLLKRRKPARNEALLEKHREQILMQYERVLNNIRDLDEDHATGKMPSGDYEAEREEWMQRGIQVLIALDALQGTRTAPPDDETALDREIEEAIAAYRARAN